MFLNINYFRLAFEATSPAALTASGAEGPRVLFRSLPLQLCDILELPVLKEG